VYSTTRAVATLLGAGIAGLLIWVAMRIDVGTTGGYWAAYGIIAAAGLTISLAQLVGGWTKWGWPRISGAVFLVGFLPALVVGGWIVVAHQPHANWFHGHVLAWSGDINVRALVRSLAEYAPVIAFGLGVLFGMTFDTTGPRLAAPAPAAEAAAVDGDGVAADGTGGARAERTPAPAATRSHARREPLRRTPAGRSRGGPPARP
jgi:hypothetical protein